MGFEAMGSACEAEMVILCWHELLTSNVVKENLKRVYFPVNSSADGALLLRINHPSLSPQVVRWHGCASIAFQLMYVEERCRRF